jgi:hypothetical protein
MGLFAPNFAEGFHAALVTRLAIVLTALQMSDGTEQEVLRAAGESCEFGKDFSCRATVEAQNARRHYLVAMGDDAALYERGLERAMVVPAEDLTTLTVESCESLKTEVGELEPGPVRRVVIYLAAQPRAVGTLIRMIFVGQVRAGGTIAVTCDSAAEVEACDVQLVQPADWVGGG